MADNSGLLCYQTFTAIWPAGAGNATVLAAVLNAPLANAFIATHDIKHNRNTTIKNIPVPAFSQQDISAIESLVNTYESEPDAAKRDSALRRIDAIVLSAYDLPPRLERELLDYFNGAERQVPFTFDDYFPHDFAPCFSLVDYLSDQFAEATAGKFVERCKQAPAAFRDAVMMALCAYGEGSQ